MKAASPSLDDILAAVTKTEARSRPDVELEPDQRAQCACPEILVKLKGILTQAIDIDRLDIDRLFEEVKMALRGDDVDAADAPKVGKCAQIVAKLLKGRPFSCSDNGAGGTGGSGGSEGVDGSDTAKVRATLRLASKPNVEMPDGSEVCGTCGAVVGRHLVPGSEIAGEDDEGLEGLAAVGKGALHDGQYGDNATGTLPGTTGYAAEDDMSFKFPEAEAMRQAKAARHGPPVSARSAAGMMERPLGGPETRAKRAHVEAKEAPPVAKSARVEERRQREADGQLLANGGVGGGATGGAEGAGGMAAAQGGDSTAVSSYLCKWAPSVVEAKNMTELRAELVRLGKTPVTSGSGKSAKVLKLDLVEQLLQFCKPKRLPRAPAAGVPLDIPTVDAPKREPNRPSNGPNADPTCPNDPGPTFLAVAPQLAAPPGARVSLSFGESGAEDDA